MGPNYIGAAIGYPQEIMAQYLQVGNLEFGLCRQARFRWIALTRRKISESWNDLPEFTK